MESKYAMAKQSDSKLVGPPSSEDVLETNTAGSSDEEDSQDIEDEKEIDNDDEEANVRQEIIC